MTRIKDVPVYCAALAAAGVMALGCGGQAASLELDGPLAGDFVAIRKPLSARTQGDAPPDLQGLPEATDDFYLAIRRGALAQRWFLGAFIKQYYPGGVQGWSKVSLGTRVVSFAEQNERLFMFDSSDQFASSAVEDPELLLEAYPIIDEPSFAELPGASDYVLVDPGAGLNRFGVAGYTYADPDLSLPVPVRIGLSFLQNFRGSSDGAAFEQVFAGDIQEEGGIRSIWGTLGVSLRRYFDGPGYVPMPATDPPHFISFTSRLLPDSAGQATIDLSRWNLHPGMEPVRVPIRGGAYRAQADFPDEPILDALVRGIESYNDVFGYRVFDAFIEDTDEVPDDTGSFMMVDYPGSGAGFAFANLNVNPNSGETLGGTVFLSGGFFDSVFEDDPAEEGGAGEPPATPAPPALTWSGLQSVSTICNYPARAGRPRKASQSDGPALPGAALTAGEKHARFIESVVAHEFGHILGLAHNFKGSLVPPASTVMDYSTDEDSQALPQAGPYDVDALHYLYRISPDLPAQPFCSDNDIVLDPTCAIFDSGAHPLEDYWLPIYRDATRASFEAEAEAADLDASGLNEVLSFARVAPDDTAVPSADRLAALGGAFEAARIPMSPGEAADPHAVELANAYAETVLRRAVLDAPDLRGFINFDIADPDVLARLAELAASVAQNVDGVRPSALRRTAVDVLLRVQAPPGLAALRAVQVAVAAELASGHLSAADTTEIQDLASRIGASLDSYYD
jgi:hypothetical protein